ncbi:hypothetical protein F2P56_015949 [Juglans regia]|uniref:Reverse transcriptase zinc-binding domain-containing protein n=1 Tax=Juglans regia TaxID=51240 RepID=A0A833XH52_JUGRE|nr:hypothetical protein F2P56_015949 [Juglans regia]
MGLKVFLWKAIHEALPTKRNLVQRKIITDGFCPWCKQFEETSCYVLWNCVAAQDVWSDLRSPVQKAALNDLQFRHIWEDLVLKLNKADIELTAYFAAAQHYLHVSITENSASSMIVRWEKPSYGWFKINWDAAYDDNLKRMGGGIVIRNWDGELMAAAGWAKPSISNPLHAEAFVLERATTQSLELGLSQCIFEGNALVLNL